MLRSLSDKEIRFCDEYLTCFNATKAAIKAGYSKKSAGVIGSQNLKKLNIQNYLKVKKKKILEKLEITQERTMLEIGRVAFADVRTLFDEEGNLIPIPDLPDNQAAIIASFEQEELFEKKGKENVQVGNLRKIKMWNKNAALEMLAKHFKIYEEAPATAPLNLVNFSKNDLRLLLSMKKKVSK